MLYIFATSLRVLIGQIEKLACRVALKRVKPIFRTILHCTNCCFHMVYFRLCVCLEICDLQPASQPAYLVEVLCRDKNYPSATDADGLHQLGGGGGVSVGDGGGRLDGGGGSGGGGDDGGYSLVQLELPVQASLAVNLCLCKRVWSLVNRFVVSSSINGRFQLKKIVGMGGTHSTIGAQFIPLIGQHNSFTSYCI